MGYQALAIIVNNAKEKFATVDRSMRDMYHVAGHQTCGCRTTYLFDSEKDQKGALFFMESEGIEILGTRSYDMGDS